jgi:hypothetical protein
LGEFLSNSSRTSILAIPQLAAKPVLRYGR